MMKFNCRPTMSRLPATLMIVGMVLSLAACGGGNGTAVEGPVEMPGESGGLMTDLGEWNTPMAGSLDIMDANSVLRAYYDASGVGRVVAAAPVQPEGTGTATWNGRWSGKIEVNPDPLVTAGLALFDASPADLADLDGRAQVTAYFEGSGVEVTLTYKNLGLDALGISEITSDRAAVSGGQFIPEKTEIAPFSIEIQGIPYSGQFTGDFTGEGAFAGIDAAGVAGYVGGNIDIEYGQVNKTFGTFQSVFYGTREEN